SPPSSAISSPRWPSPTRRTRFRTWPSGSICPRARRRAGAGEDEGAPGWDCPTPAPLEPRRRISFEVAPLRSPDEGEHDPDDQYDNNHPDEKVSPAHRGRGDAAKSKRRRDNRDDDQNQRVINKISGHMDAF